MRKLDYKYFRILKMKENNLKKSITLSGVKAQKAKERFDELKPHGFNNLEGGVQYEM